MHPADTSGDIDLLLECESGNLKTKALLPDLDRGKDQVTTTRRV
jgi:hypothetical protein